MENIDISQNNNTQTNINFNETNFNLSQRNQNKDNASSIEHKSKKSNKMLFIIISITILGLLIIIASIILIIGHFVYDWFKEEKEELIINKNLEEKIVSRYLEIKNATNYFYSQGLNETYNDTEGVNQTIKEETINILTDFIVAINKKEKISKILFGNDEYLLESFLLIINITKINETDSLFLGGINIYDESKTIEDLIKMNNDYFLNDSSNSEENQDFSEVEIDIPFCKFYFFENGTINKIYFPKDLNEFYQTAIFDIIEKVTPKLSKSLYKNETTKRRLEKEEEGTYLNYDEIIRNGKISKIIIYEDKIIKDIEKNEDQLIFENNKLYSKINRTFNPSGDMTDLEMKGEVLFISNPRIENNQNYKNLRIIEENEEKNFETNDSYYNLGLNQYKMNVTSNMKLIQKKNEPKTLEKLNNLTQYMNFTIYENLTSINNLTIKEGIETEGNNNTDQSLNETNNTNFTRNLESNNINFKHSYNSRYKFFNTNFLGLKLGLKQHLYINNKTNLRKGYINLSLGNSEITISNIEKYHYPSIPSGYYSKNVVDQYFNIYKSFKPFGFCIFGNLKLKVYLNHGIYYYISNGEMYAKALPIFKLELLDLLALISKLFLLGLK